MNAKAIVMAAGALALFAVHGGGQATSGESEVRKLEAQYQAAVKSNDLAFISAHLASSYVGIQPDGTEQDRMTVISARKANAYQVKSLQAFHQSIAMSGPTAVVTMCLQLDYTLYGKQMGGSYTVLRVWQKTGQEWKVLSLQMTPRVSVCNK